MAESIMLDKAKNFAVQIVNVRMATETFNENNQEIMYVLKSIEYLQK